MRLSVDEQIDIANRAHIRYYKKTINDLLEQRAQMQNELDVSSGLMDGFRKTVD